TASNFFILRCRVQPRVTQMTDRDFERERRSAHATSLSAPNNAKRKTQNEKRKIRNRVRHFNFCILRFAF
ncbi:MAG TPA: hypothetical protein VHC19_26025, partial [Pirellulales bacterium]|nr:hypothetical protein [Pirellulales bacterium]